MVSRKKGAIVNIGSAAGYMPVGDPLYEVYSGCKAYVDFFARSLNLSYKSKGITAEVHHPYLVPSKLSKIRSTSLFIPSADSYGYAGVAAIGHGDVVVLPHWRHALEHFLYFSILPQWLFESQLLGMHVGIRKKALAKKEKASKEN
jgi:17beta-estradiol 17-dehydrogenase / very-long-chain 3-oxoacyl-CoA reductase